MVQIYSQTQGSDHLYGEGNEKWCQKNSTKRKGALLTLGEVTAPELKDRYYLGVFALPTTGDP